MPTRLATLPLENAHEDDYRSVLAYLSLVSVLAAPVGAFDGVLATAGPVTFLSATETKWGRRADATGQSASDHRH
jgi:hypothetical protein